MESLLKKLHAKFHPTYFIGIDTYDYPLYVYQNPNLAQYIDALFIMDYDMGLTSGVTMSNSPMYCENRLDYPKSITAANEFGFPNDKIILGMPFYGYDFVTNSNKAGSPYSSVTMKDIKVAIPEASKYGRNWDSTAQTPWYAYQSGSTWHQVWYDDSESLSIKYNFAKSKNLAGIGFWALGKENANILGLFSNGGQINTDPAKIAPVASLTASLTNGNAPLTITFMDTSTGSPTAWIWSFGDGTYSTVKNPKHTYMTAGSYTIKLTASNEAGTSTNTKTNYIKVTALQKPDANFWGSTRSGYAPLTVTFTDASTGSPTAWKWSFGDGTYSTVKNPKHKYSKAGRYTVKLTASNKAGSGTMTKTSYIKVNSPRSRG
jgi:PKD repeat protein